MSIQKEVNFNLKNFNTLKISAIADEIYFPKNQDEMVEILELEPNAYVFGAGSNLLFSTLGFCFPLICTKNMSNFKLDDETIEVEAGCSVQKLSKFAYENFLSGFEFLIGIPATIGGAVAMNAGCHGQSISDVVQSVKVYDKKEKIVKEFKNNDLDYGYRTSVLKKNLGNFIVLSAKFKLKKVPQSQIEEKMSENIEFRKKVQPNLSLPNLGSVFQNHTNANGEKVSAGLLIDKCNLKGFTLGGAKVWENHANFVVNFNNCTSNDYLNLIFKMYDSVRESFDIKLKPEIIFVGKMREDEELKWKTMLKN